MSEKLQREVSGQTKVIIKIHGFLASEENVALMMCVKKGTTLEELSSLLPINSEEIGFYTVNGKLRENLSIKNLLNIKTILNCPRKYMSN